MAAIRRTSTSFGAVANKSHVQKAVPLTEILLVTPTPIAALPARQTLAANPQLKQVVSSTTSAA
jgi:hypothetical protein